MKRTLGFLFLLVIAGLTGACATEKTSNNANANTAPANVGVVTNNNGNKNTAGVRPINGNVNSNQK